MAKGRNKSKSFKALAAGNLPAIVIGVVLVLGVIWWALIHFVYDSPTLLFNAMLSNSLSTTGVVENLREVSGSNIINQTALVQLGGKNRIEIYKTEVVGSSSSIVNTLIGTPSEDYTKFDNIKSAQLDDSGQPINYSQILGVWAYKTYSVNGGQLLKDAVLNPVLIGDLNGSQKQAILSYIKSNEVYDIVSVKKAVSDHRLRYDYEVDLDLQPYTVVLSKFGVDLGFPDAGINGSQTLVGQSTKLNIVVDAVSRQLVSISYVNSKISETFSSFGIRANIGLPAHAVTVTSVEALINDAIRK